MNKEKEKIKSKINILKNNYKVKNKNNINNKKIKIIIGKNDIEKEKEIYFLKNSFITSEKLNDSNINFYCNYIKYKFPNNLKFKIEGI